MAPPTEPAGQLSLLDERPIELDGFRFKSKGVQVIGRPTFPKFWNALELAIAMQEASPYWVGDLMVYAESRSDYNRRLEQAIEATGYRLKTIQNLTSICRRVSTEVRELSPSVGHSDLVAALPRIDQEHWLEEARDKGLGIRELRQTMRSAGRRAIIEGQARLEGQYRVIYADPPWIYDDRQPSGSGSEIKFPGMTIEQLCALPVGVHSMPNAVLAMWITAPMMFNNPGPREVGEAWGFEYKQQLVWDKVDGAGGNYTRGNHEILTLWTRGSCVPDVQTDLPDSVVTIRKSHVHSEKPREFRALLEKHWTTGPYLELFGRERVEGWTVFGNDAALWAEEVA
jgi:N6-adenosine-specific RNA methylase IME4